MDSVVFSFWKSTLDLASSALAEEGFTCLQIDGKTPTSQRSVTLTHFSELKTEAVLLMSLSCGAVGYVLDRMAPCGGYSDLLFLPQTQSYSRNPCVPNGAAVESSDRGASFGEGLPTWTDSASCDRPLLYQEFDRRGEWISALTTGLLTYSQCLVFSMSGESRGKRGN